MGWGGAAGGGSAGIPTGPASPEVAWATDEDRHREGGPRDDDPDPRPGCLRTVVTVALVVAVLAVLMWLAGRLLG